MRLSLFFFLHLVVFIILLIVHPHARANDGWTIADGDKNYIYLTKNGEYLYGDRLIFSLNYKNCNKIYQLFTFLTTKGDSNIYQFENKKIPITLNDTEFHAEVIHIEKILNHKAHWVVFELGRYETQRYVKLLNGFIAENDKYEISLKNGLHFEVKKYFDITKNKWNLANFSENFSEFYKRCKEKKILKES